MDGTAGSTTLHPGASRPAGFERASTGSSVSMLPLRFSGKDRRNEIWAWYKEAIYEMYMSQDATLSQTMKRFQQQGLLACQRTWKMKLKEWGFEKYRSEAEMEKLLAQYEACNTDGETPTKIMYKGLVVKPQKITNFKRRRSALDIVDPQNTHAKKPRGGTRIRETQTKIHRHIQQRSRQQPTHSSSNCSSYHQPPSERENQPNFAHRFADFPILSRGYGNFLRFIKDLKVDVNSETSESLYSLWKTHQHKQLPLTALSEKFKGEKEWKRFDLILRLERIIINIEFSKAGQLELLNTISEFLDFLQYNLTIFPSRDAEVSFERLLSILQNVLGPGLEATIQMTERLADFYLLYYPEKSAISELYRSAIEGFQSLKQEDDVFRCQVSLADVLYTQGYIEESLSLFVGSLSEYICLHLDSWIIHKPPRVCYELGLRRSRPYNLYCTNTVWRRLRKIKRAICCKSRRVRARGYLDDDGQLYTEVLHLAADVGDLLSRIPETDRSEKWQKSIEALFSAVIPKIECLGDEEFGELKAYAYLARSSHHMNTRSWALCLHDISRCHQYFLQAEHYDRRGLLLGPSQYFDTFQEKIFHHSVTLSIEVAEFAAALNTSFTEFRWPSFCDTRDFVFPESEAVLDFLDNYDPEYNGETSVQPEGGGSQDDVSREINTPQLPSLKRKYKTRSRTQSIISMRSNDSSDYGITYSDGASVMSGVSFNYSRLFIAT